MELQNYLDEYNDLIKRARLELKSNCLTMEEKVRLLDICGLDVLGVPDEMKTTVNLMDFLLDRELVRRLEYISVDSIVYILTDEDYYEDIKQILNDRTIEDYLDEIKMEFINNEVRYISNDF